jgi:bifunctional non-homologous end joining protein LigD
LPASRCAHIKVALSYFQGFAVHWRQSLLEKLKPLRASACPFSNLPDADKSRWGGGVTADQMDEMLWTKPKLVVQIRFVEWTEENRLRHAKYLGLRPDKAPQEVQREP